MENNIFIALNVTVKLFVCIICKGMSVNYVVVNPYASMAGENKSVRNVVVLLFASTEDPSIRVRIVVEALVAFTIRYDIHAKCVKARPRVCMDV